MAGTQHEVKNASYVACCTALQHSYHDPASSKAYPQDCHNYQSPLDGCSRHSTTTARHASPSRLSMRGQTCHTCQRSGQLQQISVLLSQWPPAGQTIGCMSIQPSSPPPQQQTTPSRQVSWRQHNTPPMLVPWPQVSQPAVCKAKHFWQVQQTSTALWLLRIAGHAAPVLLLSSQPAVAAGS